jgi:hypothetical protein
MEVIIMHVLILAPTPDAADEVQTVLGDATDHYSRITWEDKQ